MSVHGCCYDEGQSGNCGIECRCFMGGECSIPCEIASIFSNELLEEYGDPFKLAVIKAQTRKDPKVFLEEELKQLMENEFGYQI